MAPTSLKECRTVQARPRRWHDFGVSAHERPAPSGATVDLVKAGRLESSQMTGPTVAGSRGRSDPARAGLHRPRHAGERRAQPGELGCSALGLSRPRLRYLRAPVGPAGRRVGDHSEHFCAWLHRGQGGLCALRHHSDHEVRSIEHRPLRRPACRAAAPGRRPSRAGPTVFAEAAILVCGACLTIAALEADVLTAVYRRHVGTWRRCAGRVGWSGGMPWPPLCLCVTAPAGIGLNSPSNIWRFVPG